MERVVYSITFGQLFFCLASVLYIFSRIYNKSSDRSEKEQNYKWKSFLFNFVISYFPNIFQAFIGGILLLAIANEVGIEYIAKHAFSFQLGSLEQSIDITTAIICGLTGDFVLGKLIKLVTKVSPNNK